MDSLAQAEKAAGTTASPPDTRHGEPESGTSSLSLDKDVAIGLVGEHAHEIDPMVEARVLRKIDWFLIPAMIVGESTISSLLHDVGKIYVTMRANQHV